MSIITKSLPLPISEEEIRLFIEVRFPIAGKSLPSDHGYGLCSAISHQIPGFHQEPLISLITASGFPDCKGLITLTPQSCLRVRLPVTKIPLIYPLAGKQLTIGHHKIQVRIPEIYPLKPASSLQARLVVIKGYMEPEEFEIAAKRQLEELGISGELTVLSRKTIKIKRFTVVGFTTKVTSLNPEDALKLQVLGLGGKRRMGCGVFVGTGEEP